MNTRHLKEGIQKIKEDLHPYYEPTDKRLEVRTCIFCNLVSCVHAVVGENLSGLPGFMECLSAEFQGVFRHGEMYNDTEF